MERSEFIAKARKRLVGTWRSDRARTIQHWVFPKRIAAVKLRFFKSIFGKTTWRFTQQLFYGEYEDTKWKSKYELLWADDYSVVVLFKMTEGEKCHHLFFEDEHFYVVAGRAGNAEYFKRVAP